MRSRLRGTCAALLASPLLLVLAACGGDNVRPTAPPPVTTKPVPAAPEPKVGIALGGGAAKGFAHIGVIKMLEANGIEPTPTPTSAS